MSRLKKKTDIYKISNNSEYNLKQLGFRRTANNTWQKRFSAYKHKGKTTLEAEFTIFEGNKEVFVNLYCLDGALYAPYYYQKNNKIKDNLVLTVCNKRIASVMKECGIKNG